MWGHTFITHSPTHTPHLLQTSPLSILDQFFLPDRFELNSDSKGYMCSVKTVSVRMFGLRSRHVCWMETSPCRLVGQTCWILDTPASTAYNWSQILHSVCFLGVNHLYLLLWFIAIVAFSVLNTSVHCFYLIGLRAQLAEISTLLSDQTPDSLSHRFPSFTTTVSVSLCHHCFHHLAIKSV